jgi:hypothetical protein
MSSLPSRDVSRTDTPPAESSATSSSSETSAVVSSSGIAYPGVGASVNTTS